MAHKIVRNKDYSAYYYKNNGISKKIIVICFDVIAGGLKEKGFGVDFFEKNNIEVIFVSHRKWSFYQGLSEESLYDCLNGYLEGKQVFTYGTSLGGYAALYYAPILKAKAIAFSPRCDLDPIYDGSSKYSTKFEHTFLDRQSIKSVKKPIIFIDDNNATDIKYFRNRIFPAYQDHMDKVSLLNSTHHIPKVLVELGILKKIILYILKNERPPEIEFDFMDSTHCLSYIARDKAVKGFYEDANIYLERIIYLQESSMSKFSMNEWRLMAYKALVEKSQIKHVFNRSLITEREKERVFIKQVNSIKKKGTTDLFLNRQFEMHTLLMDYDSAVKLAEAISLYFPKNSKYKDLLSQAKRNFENAEGWII